MVLKSGKYSGIITAIMSEEHAAKEKLDKFDNTLRKLLN